MSWSGGEEIVVEAGARDAHDAVAVSFVEGVHVQVDDGGDPQRGRRRVTIRRSSSSSSTPIRSRSPPLSLGSGGVSSLFFFLFLTMALA